uniref:Uncharacterized protein n=1 Tax=Pristionchus pacificus TaxID=54126 RepID=A0A2A6CNS6_PRIPA|eukprot:PDM79756.1 hypothetical protein PRIPAC_32335 [Pristionchus pacificus]
MEWKRSARSMPTTMPAVPLDSTPTAAESTHDRSSHNCSRSNLKSKMSLTYECTVSPSFHEGVSYALCLCPSISEGKH